MEPTNARFSRFRFTIRGLMLVTLLGGLALGSCVYLVSGLREEKREGPYENFDAWPQALKRLIGKDSGLQRDVEPYELDAWVDHRSIWRLQATSPLYDRLLEQNPFEPADSKHPMATRLMESVPSDWGQPRWSQWLWYATPGYGTTFMDGADLYLVAEDPATGEVIVLHEWIF
ncbi:hypothetical protein [Blastopirellula marina]|uniref:Uncharacterized protein n=1 Tax=Blastopirellula marina TaxID=124 RepID=A0A2S8G8Q7_9BACT|nr:hypothetical protein [Blastopirellula marina]PQO40828.1 hypothetical protein C5Y98_04425 [Blastopirellula marina]PTL45710.1 hypothetical protein C5Y97_04425 [Blastopirellula marina]